MGPFVTRAGASNFVRCRNRKEARSRGGLLAGLRRSATTLHVASLRDIALVHSITEATESGEDIEPSQDRSGSIDVTVEERSAAVITLAQTVKEETSTGSRVGMARKSLESLLLFLGSTQNDLDSLVGLVGGGWAE